MAIDIEKLSDEDKELLIVELQKSLKKSKAAAKPAKAVKATVSKGQGCLGASIAERRAQLR